MQWFGGDGPYERENFQHEPLIKSILAVDARALNRGRLSKGQQTRGTVNASLVVEGQEDLRCQLLSESSKGSYATPNFSFSFPWVELEKLHVGCNLHLYPFMNLE